MKTIHALRNSGNRSSRRRGSLLIPLGLVAFLTILTRAQAVSPPPDGGYPGANTAEGKDALLNLTSGTGDTAVGQKALLHNTTGSGNVGTGTQTLFSNITGNNNTANGFRALYFNTADENTATGAGALLSNTTGLRNTASGAFALFSNTEGSYNTAAGDQALFSNTAGTVNTAIGTGALTNNTTGGRNTAIGGDFVLFSNTTGSFNTAIGVDSLAFNTTGADNTANGAFALDNNTTGAQNTAVGYAALASNTTAGANTSGANTAVGAFALQSNTTSGANTAIGYAALGSIITNGGNTAIGFVAGFNLTGSQNICIGAGVGGISGENNRIRIGNNLPTGAGQSACYVGGIAGQTVGAGGSTCYVDNAGKLGVFLSARRFKTDIADMGDLSEALLALRPVTFHYKPELDKTGIPQFGLIAEEVAKVNPDLVTHDAKGELSTVRYEAVNAMLLNEFLKEHRKVEAQQSKIDKQEATMTELRSIIAQQQEGMEVLAARLDEQAAQIQKVSEQIEMKMPSLRTADNH